MGRTVLRARRLPERAILKRGAGCAEDPDRESVWTLEVSRSLKKEERQGVMERLNPSVTCQHSAGDEVGQALEAPELGHSHPRGLPQPCRSVHCEPGGSAGMLTCRWMNTL